MSRGPLAPRIDDLARLLRWLQAHGRTRAARERYQREWEEFWRDYGD